MQNQMLKLLDDEDVQLTVKEILEQVLGMRSSYARGMGKFVIPTTSSSRSHYPKEINNELETCRQELLATKQELVEVKEEMTQAKEQMEITNEHVIQLEANQRETQHQLAETQRLIACLMANRL
jgi:septal ring factor EnvC (AmiA/AmiB activator)